MRQVSNWEFVVLVNLRNMYSMAGGVHCEKCRRANTYSITVANASLVKEDGLERLKVEQLLVCDKCDHHRSIKWEIKQEDHTEPL